MEMETRELAQAPRGTRSSLLWLFRDREDAGRQLARRLEQYRLKRPVVLALPRGGVPVAYQIAEALEAPLDVLPVRKIGCPGQRELRIGAIALGGEPILDHDLIRALGISPGAVTRVEAEERTELERQRQRFRGDRPLPELADRTVIIVDDGLATGVTARAAIHAVRALGPRQIVVAVPVAAPESADELRPQVDDLVCIACPTDFFAVGLWYREFLPTSDETVISLLQQARRWDEASPSSGTER